MASRKEKYPNTETFTYYNANPKNRITCDCVARAVCTGLNEPYNDVIKEMFKIQIETGYEYTDAKGIEKYLESKGWKKHKQPRKANNTKYTGEEFCKRIAEKDKRYICNIGGHHIVAIVDKKVHDIWDSTFKCIGNYWTKD